MDDEKRKISENIISYLVQEMENVQYGKITIELRDNSDKIDIIVEQRKRFAKGNSKNNGLAQKYLHKG